MVFVEYVVSEMKKGRIKFDLRGLVQTESSSEATPSGIKNLQLNLARVRDRDHVPD